MEKVTLNYYPTSERFMLTGTTKNRSPFETFFKNLVGKGPVYENDRPPPKVQPTQMFPKKLQLEDEGEEDEDEGDNDETVVETVTALPG